MRIKQRIPGFIEGVEPQEAEVESLDQLLGLPWIQRWTSDKTFEKLMWAPDGFLMAILKDKSFWVIAYMESNDFGLPVWKATV